MFVEIEVEVIIRKGLGPDHFRTCISVGLDDLPEETTRDEIKKMAKAEVDQKLMNTEDYPVYGHNWEILHYWF